MEWNSVRTSPPHGETDGDPSTSRQAGADWSTTRDPGPGRVTVSTRDLAQIRAIAEASALALRDVVARFDQVAGPMKDHYGQVEQWSTVILGRP